MEGGKGARKFHANSSQCIRNSKLSEQEEEEERAWNRGRQLEPIEQPLDLEDDMRLKREVRGLERESGKNSEGIRFN